MTPLFLLMGPTAAGKTDLAVRLAERLPVDLVSVDPAPRTANGAHIGRNRRAARTATMPAP